MRIYRTMDAFLDDSLRIQVLEQFLFPLALGETARPTFEDLLLRCDIDAHEDLLDAVAGLLEDKVLLEAENRQLILAQPVAAMEQAGLWLEDHLQLVPEGTRLLSLSVDAEQDIAERGVEAVVADLAPLLKTAFVPGN